MTYKLAGISIDQIEIGERRRTDMGDMDALARSIQRHGFIHFPVVDPMADGRYRLIAGGRRLRAAQMLGMKTIPVQLRDELSEAELRDIELDETEIHKHFTDEERLRTFFKSQRIVEDAKRQSAISSPSEEKDPRGRKSTYTKPKKEIAKDLGISEGSLIEAEQHVEMATEFPAMQGPGWRQSHVLAVREYLDDLPAEDRKGIGEVLAIPKLLDPGDAVKLIGNMAAMKPADRQEIFELSRSEDPREQSLALTKAAELPPMPDPRLNSIEAALDSLRRASKPFPNDPLTPRIDAVIAELKKIHSAVKEVSFDARRKEGAVQ